MKTVTNYKDVVESRNVLAAATADYELKRNHALLEIVQEMAATECEYTAADLALASGLHTNSFVNLFQGPKSNEYLTRLGIDLCKYGVVLGTTQKRQTFVLVLEDRTVDTSRTIEQVCDVTTYRLRRKY